MWIGVRVLLYERVNDFFRCREKVLKCWEREDIHDLRVASRRMREGLTLFEPCYPPEVMKKSIRRIRRVTRSLGDIRNADEAGAFFAGLAADLGEVPASDLQKIPDSLQATRKKRLKKLKSHLQELVPPSSRNHYLSIVNSPALFSPAETGIDLFAPIASFAATSFDGLYTSIAELVPTARREDEIGAQHLLRIAVKHFRYRMELLSFLMQHDFAELHAAIKGYQQVLGDMHDLDVFRGMAGEAGISDATKEAVADAVQAVRRKSFADFCGLLQAAPLEALCERVRSAV